MTLVYASLEEEENYQAPRAERPIEDVLYDTAVRPVPSQRSKTAKRSAQGHAKERKRQSEDALAKRRARALEERSSSSVLNAIVVLMESEKRIWFPLEISCKLDVLPTCIYRRLQQLVEMNIVKRIDIEGAKHRASRTAYKWCA